MTVAVTRHAILEAARQWIGTPYMHQASALGQGCDCLGLVRGIWRTLYGNEPEALPSYSADWAEARACERLAEAARRHCAELSPGTAQPADLLLFRWRANVPAKHAGILAPEGRLIHAHDGACVAEVPLGIWRNRIAFAFRFPGVND